MAEIPTIDFTNFPSDEPKLRQACENLGCFRVIGHGIPASLRDDMKSAVRSLFHLPDHIKRLNTDVIHGSGYLAPSPVNPLYEAFGLYDASSSLDILSFCSNLQASPFQQHTIATYSSKLHALVVDIANKIAKSIGVPHYSFEHWPCQFRLNKYSFTEGTIGSSGVQIHTDTSFLTVLQEDDSVGGLEIMDQTGTFVPVHPVPDSFLVNLGDMAKLWSNGRLHNLMHRVQCKEAAERISIALFLLGPKDAPVEPPPELVDSEHPRLYKSITVENYRRLWFPSSRAGESLSHLLL
ncbi:Iron/ascorbate family oxidoreductases protein [Dioscorea alata]|uniref:Iron/ascorbate family oxidoreductases protein n=2 Tax=Dioscorea alata TaxID=55571 RepID=A0ACB7VIL4_DIOAL|nr:Iron/ascorbate family oxidoreductases protein [Dioscorea alata]KAH7673983.1 Iron/ascorbate family oxidoreductases protein [Dioscorea alata]